MDIYLVYGCSKCFRHNCGMNKTSMSEQSTWCPHLRHSEFRRRRRRRETKSWRNFRKLLHWEVQYGSYPDKHIHKQHRQKNMCKSLNPKEYFELLSLTIESLCWKKKKKPNPAVNPSTVILQSRGEAQLWVQSGFAASSAETPGMNSRSDAALKRHMRLRGVLAPVLQLVSINQEQTSRHPVWVCLCCSLGLGPALPGSYAHAGQWGELRDSETSTPSWFSLQQTESGHKDITRWFNSQEIWFNKRLGCLGSVWMHCSELKLIQHQQQ